jgi:putative Holliday junction resolvase
VGERRLRSVLAVDPGEVRLGIALSDPTQTIARPLDVIRHRSRDEDARQILALAREHQVERIVVGIALDARGKAGPQARRGLRLAEAIRRQADTPVVTWDETGSTEAALQLAGTRAPIDARAAAVILQEYLDAHPPT